MSELTIESLGLSKEDILDRVVDRISDRLLSSYYVYGDEDDEVGHASVQFMKEMEAKVTDKVNAAIEEIAAKNVLPNVAEYVENLCLQETNQWGEARGEAKTFREYLVSRAENYLSEKVNYKGESKSEAGGYSWSARQTRITHLVHQHLEHEISFAMKNAMKAANSKIAEGIQETVKIKLAEITKSLKVQTKI